MQFVVTMKRVKLSAIHKSSASSIYFTTFITLLLVCPEKCSMQGKKKINLCEIEKIIAYLWDPLKWNKKTCKQARRFSCQQIVESHLAKGKD